MKRPFDNKHLCPPYSIGHAHQNPLRRRNNHAHLNSTLETQCPLNCALAECVCLHIFPQHHRISQNRVCGHFADGDQVLIDMTTRIPDGDIVLSQQLSRQSWTHIPDRKDDAVSRFRIVKQSTPNISGLQSTISQLKGLRALTFHLPVRTQETEWHPPRKKIQAKEPAKKIHFHMSNQPENPC